MRTPSIGIITAMLLFVSLARPSFADPPRVYSIGDGDTIRVRSGSSPSTIRLACIDSPEMSQAPYGRQSKAKLTQLLPIGSPITLRELGKDQYGRVVAEVFNGSQNINLLMVSSGESFVYRSYLKGCNRSDYLAAEELAKNSRAGVWSPTPDGILRPWIWRNQLKYRSRFTCSGLTSRAEAERLYRQGHTYLDGSNDGIPCNGI